MFIGQNHKQHSFLKSITDREGYTLVIANAVGIAVEKVTSMWQSKSLITASNESGNF